MMILLALALGFAYLFLLLGMVIGYFVGKMLLNRTLKVFGKKSLISFAVLVAVVGGSLLVTWIDPLGVVSYVPKAEQVEAAYIYGADKNNYYLVEYSFMSYVGGEEDSGFQITEAEELAQLQDFHRQLTECRPSENDGVLCDVRIRYQLKSGRTVTRYYKVGRSTPLGQRAGKYFNDMRYIFEVNDTQILYNAFDGVAVDIFDGEKRTEFKLTNQKKIAGLLDAIAKDCEAGTMAQNWAFHIETDKIQECNIEFYVKDSVREQGGWGMNRFYLRIWEDSIHTQAYINTMR